MSTTVTYKGNTIATVDNNTKTLKTAGKYMEGDVVLTDVSGGGGGDKWVRPSSWPDLSKMDVSGGDIIYMTSYADEARGFCNIYISCTGSYTVEVGTISGSTFTAESTHTISSGNRCQLYYGSANGTYKVLRVTGTNITVFEIGNDTSAITIDTFNGYTCNNGIIDVVGRLPSCNSMSHKYCYNLINMEIDGVALSGTMIGMFNNCTSLTSLDVSGWDTSAVTSMNSMFINCYSLTSLDVSGWDTSAVMNMASMFYYCASLTSLDVSGWDTSAVKNMNYMFYCCTSLTSLDVSGWDTSAVTSMNSMFYNCYSLTSLDVSGWDFSKITITSNASSIFRYCHGLHGSITIPASVTKIGTDCFGDTRSLYEYHFLSTTPPTLAGTNAFNNMTDFGGKKIYVPSASLEAYQTATNWSTYASQMVGE